MMQSITIILFLLLATLNGSDLIEKYKAGNLTIEADQNFNTSYPWYEGVKGRALTDRYTNLEVNDEGNLFILNRPTKSLLVFKNNGDLLSEFDLKNDIEESIRGICTIDDSYVVVNSLSAIYLFTQEGVFLKCVNFDFSVYEVIGIDDNLIAIRGFVTQGYGKSKDYVALYNIKSEKVVSEYNFNRVNFYERRETVTWQVGSTYLSIGIPDRAPRTFVRSLRNGNFIVANSGEPILGIFGKDGIRKGKLALTYSRKKTTIHDIEVTHKELTEALQRKNAPDSLYKVIDPAEFYHPEWPYYYDIMVDSDNNILIFKYDESKDHVFLVYRVFSSDGEFVCESRLDIKDYNFDRLARFVFYDGYLYGFTPTSKDVPKIYKLKIL